MPGTALTSKREKGVKKMVRTQRKNLTGWLGLLIIFTLLLVVALSSQTALSSLAVKFSKSDVRLLSNGSVVPDAGSMIFTTDEGAAMILHTSELPANNAVTVWWVIFNRPENCTAGDNQSRCGMGDLENNMTQPSVMFAAGTVSNARGNASFGAHLPVGDTEGCQAGLPCGEGLTNPMGADINLIVRDHGPLVPEALPDQILTFGGGCNNAPPGTGTPGQFACEDLQGSG